MNIRLKSLEKAIKIAGNKTALAKLLKVYPQTIHGWISRGQVSNAYAVRIEEVLKGQIKRWELRPDIYPPEEYKGK